MIKTSTHSDIIRYIYNQLNKTEKSNFESELLVNSHLKFVCDEYLFLLEEIDKINFIPSKKLIHKIKSFSESYNLPLRCNLYE